MASAVGAERWTGDGALSPVAESTFNGRFSSCCAVQCRASVTSRVPLCVCVCVCVRARHSRVEYGNNNGGREKCPLQTGRRRLLESAGHSQSLRRTHQRREDVGRSVSGGQVRPIADHLQFAVSVLCRCRRSVAPVDSPRRRRPSALVQRRPRRHRSVAFQCGSTSCVVAILLLWRSHPSCSEFRGPRFILLCLGRDLCFDRALDCSSNRSGQRYVST